MIKLRSFGKIATLLALTVFSASAANAGDMEKQAGFGIVKSSGNLADTLSDLENAIINQGLVIDYKGKVGEMLARTGDAVGSKSPYSDAVYMQFCSAKHTHAVVAADPRNVAVCPYVVFAYEMADGSGVMLGYRRPVGAEGAASAEALAGVDSLLEAIITEAADGL